MAAADPDASGASLGSSDALGSELVSWLAAGWLAGADGLASPLEHAATTSASSATSRIDIRFKCLSYGIAARAG
jgi:hypothetical protein